MHRVPSGLQITPPAKAARPCRMVRYHIIVTALLMSIAGCGHSRTIGTWLRIQTRSETTIIPHLLTLGGGSTVVQVLRNGAWATAYEERGTLRLWSLDQSQAALLHFAEAEQGGYYALLHSGSPDAKKFPAADAQMLPSVDGKTVVRIEWTSSQSVPAEISVRTLDAKGTESRERAVFALPAPPGRTQEKTCFYSQFIGYRGNVPVLEDAVCGSGRLELTAPPRALAPGEAVDRIAGATL